MGFVKSEADQEESAVSIDLQWAATILLKYDKSTFFPSKAFLRAKLWLIVKLMTLRQGLTTLLAVSWESEASFKRIQSA